jgi:hypothetical protein
LIRFVCCILTTPTLGTLSLRKSPLRYSVIVAHVPRFPQYSRLLEISASVKVLVCCVHHAGGAWACRKAKTQTISWLLLSQSTSPGGSAHLCIVVRPSV